jgi:hypothetical protein
MPTRVVKEDDTVEVVHVACHAMPWAYYVEYVQIRDVFSSEVAVCHIEKLQQRKYCVSCI